MSNQSRAGGVGDCATGAKIPLLLQQEREKPGSKEEEGGVVSLCPGDEGKPLTRFHRRQEWEGCFTEGGSSRKGVGGQLKNCQQEVRIRCPFIRRALH